MSFRESVHIRKEGRGTKIHLPLCHSILYVEDCVLPDEPYHEVEHERDGHAEDADKVDVDTGLDHLCDGDIARRIDNRIRRCGHRQHEAE